MTTYDLLLARKKFQSSLAKKLLAKYVIFPKMMEKKLAI